MKLKFISTFLLVLGFTFIFKAYRGEISNLQSTVGWVSVASGIGFMLIADKYPHI
tara:strand:- start:18 stop:182 length:165 start_codon:yes stop_codon:yes gene_type:complete